MNHLCNETDACIHMIMKFYRIFCHQHLAVFHPKVIMPWIFSTNFSHLGSYCLQVWHFYSQTARHCKVTMTLNFDLLTLICVIHQLRLMFLPSYWQKTSLWPRWCKLPLPLIIFSISKSVNLRLCNPELKFTDLKSKYFSNWSQPLSHLMASMAERLGRLSRYLMVPSSKLRAALLGGSLTALAKQGR